MKLWILRPVKDLPDDDNPWEPWYDKVFGFVARGETEGDARKFAQKETDEELEIHSADTRDWLNPKHTTCEELLSSGDAGVILFDFRGS